jgi:regulator of replication initiation timing
MDESNAQGGLAEFTALSEQLSREIRKLKQHNVTLQSENERIRSEVERLRKSKDLFADLPDNQKIVLKKQIEELIGRIDKHLES